MKSGTKIIHVEFNKKNLHKMPDNPKGKDFLFGSLNAIYTVFKVEDVDAKIRDLHKLDGSNPLVTKTCTISKNVIVRKKTNRKPPIKILRVVD